MKRFFKFCGALALILIIVGVILWGIGAVTVGSQNINDMVEELTEGRIQIDLKGIRLNLEKAFENNAIYDIDDVDMFDKNYEVWEDEVEKKQVADSGVSKLNIELGGCMFELERSGDDSYYAEYTGKGKSQMYVKGDELYIKVLSGNEWNVINWNNDYNDNCLTLYVPDITLNEVEIDLGAGQMKLDNLLVKDIEIDLGAGQILSNGMQAEKVALSVGAGEIVLEEVQIRDVQAEVGAGNCEIRGDITGNIEAECAMGNMTLELAGSEKDFNYEIQCVTGNITVGNNEYSGLSQEQSINNNAAKNIELECAMGNVEVEFAE